MRVATHDGSETEHGGAIAVACRRHESSLFRAALRITHNEADAWGAVREAMSSALRHAGPLHGEATIASRLYAVVVDVAHRQRASHALSLGHGLDAGRAR